MAEIKDRERSIKDLMNTYKHFTGTMEEVCRAGVNYEDVKDRHPDRTDLAPAYRFALPCFERHREYDCRTVCDKRDLPTLEEATQLADERESRITEFLHNLANNICPTHKRPITKTQVGRCVYAKECGCRLYQGRIDRGRSDKGEETNV